MSIKPAPDKHIRRTGDDYAQAFLALLPQGQAWPKTPGTTLERATNGLSQYWGSVDGRAGDLLERESDPRATIELLPDWERAWGLPDPCFQEPLTIGDRRIVLLQKITLLGAQSRAWFIGAAAQLHYDITIGEYAPYMTGIGRCGITLDPDMAYMSLELPPPNVFAVQQRWQVAAPEIRFYWKIYVHNAKLTWFRCTQSECGVDPHLIIGLATDLECLMQRWKPAHTEIIFDYSGLATGGSMAGTP